MSGREGWAAVLFDLDGTLADTVELIFRSYRHTMRTHLGRELPDERWLATMGTPLASQMAAFARDADEAARMVDTYVTYQRRVHDELVDAYPGAVGVVRELRGRGTPVGLVTSKLSPVAARTVACCGLEGAFDVLVCADHVENAKPHPEPVERALESLGLGARAGSVLFVGDSPFDLRSGRAAGTRTGAALWGPFARASLELEGPDYLFSEPGEILGSAPPR